MHISTMLDFGGSILLSDGYMYCTVQFYLKSESIQLHNRTQVEFIAPMALDSNTLLGNDCRDQLSGSHIEAGIIDAFQV
jgi:hypothetical protein